MGLNITLENEQGEKLDEVIDSSRMLLTIMNRGNQTDSCCLQLIDPYGDTVFNRLQMDQLSMDLTKLHSLTEDAEQRELISKIEELVKKCKQVPHLYIKIYGD